MKPRFYVCPACGSMDIQPDHIPQIGQMFRCLSCENESPAIIEADTLADARRMAAQIALERGDPRDP